MENISSENELVQTAKLLSELQKQLVQYKSALDSIDLAAQSNQNVSNELARMSQIFETLQQNQEALVKSFDDTRRALIFTQQKTQQVRKDMDEMSQGFARNINAGLQKTVQAVDQKIAQIAAPDRDIVQKEVKKLKLYLFANILVMFVLFLSVFLYFNNGNTQTNSPNSRSNFTQSAPLKNRMLPSKKPPSVNATRQKFNIQILNGCGTSGVAQIFEKFLQEKNYRVARTENADRFDYQQSMIYLNGDFPNQAAQIARYLGINLDNIKPAPARWKTHNVTIVIGKDNRSLTPLK